MILGVLAAGTIVSGGVLLARRLSGIRSSAAATSTEATEMPSGSQPEHGGGSTAPSGETTDAEESPLTAEMQSLDRFIAFGAMSLTLSGIGALGVPAAALLSIPFAVYPAGTLIWKRWVALRTHGQVDYGTVLGATSCVLLGMGHIGTLALGITVFYGGRRVLLATRRTAEDALADAFGEWSGVVVVMRDGEQIEVHLEDVRSDDLVEVVAGRAVPVDGVVAEGVLLTDERIFTGEARLVERHPGGPMMAGALVVGGRGWVRAERAGAETQAARLKSLLDGTRSYEQTIELQSDEMIDRTIVPTLGMAALGAAVQGPIGVVGGVWSNCVDLVWLTSPVAVLQTLRAAARGGLLIKDGRSLDQLEKIDTVVFDKTGTLTLDTFEVHAVRPIEGEDADRLLCIAAAVEGGQDHPIAKAIVTAAARVGGPDHGWSIDAPKFSAGLGLEVAVEGQTILLGSSHLLNRADVPLDPALATAVEHAEARGDTAVHMAVDKRHVAAIELRPRIRDEARGLIRRMRERGLDVMILTGDAEEPTRHLADALGIETWFARVSPEGKQGQIQHLIDDGRRVCFVGDGVNDALAMQTAHVSVSMAGASTLAVDSAQCVLQSGTLAGLELLFALGDRHGEVQRNLVGAAMVPTAASFAGVVLGGLPLAGVVGVYSVGLLGSLVWIYRASNWTPESE